MNPLTFESPPVRLQPTQLIVTGRLDPTAVGYAYMYLQNRTNGYYYGEIWNTNTSGIDTITPLDGPTKPIFMNAPAANSILSFRWRMISAAGGSGWGYYVENSSGPWAHNTWYTPAPGQIMSFNSSGVNFGGTFNFFLDFSLAGSNDAFRSLSVSLRVTA